MSKPEVKLIDLDDNADDVIIDAYKWINQAGFIQSKQTVKRVRLTSLPVVEVSFGPFPPRPERGETVPMCIANLRGIDKPHCVPYDDKLATLALMKHVWPDIEFELA